MDVCKGVGRRGGWEGGSTIVLISCYNWSTHHNVTRSNKDQAATQVSPQRPRPCIFPSPFCHLGFLRAANRLCWVCRCTMLP